MPLFGMTFLETARLSFRPHQPEDEQAFIEMQTDPEVRRYVGGQPWSKEKAVYRFRNQFLGKPAHRFGLWATILKDEDRYIGYCGLHSGSSESATLAYYLARPYWRRGLATEASVAFIDAAFSRLGLARLVADVEKGNDASEHILQKLGFIFAGREEIPGRVFHTYRIERENWPARSDT